MRSKDVQELLGISQDKLHNLVKLGVIKATKQSSGSYDYDAASVRSVIQRGGVSAVLTAASRTAVSQQTKSSSSAPVVCHRGSSGCH